MLKRILTATALAATLLFTIQAEAKMLPQKTWVKYYRTKFPSYLCVKYQNMPDLQKALKNNQISYKQCTKLVAKSLNTCLTQYQKELPDQFNVNNSQRWGRVIGSCASNQFYSKNIKKQATRSAENIKKKAVRS